MHVEWNKKYTTISVYALIVFLICLILFKSTESWENTKGFFSGMLDVLMPVIIGMFIAYFMNFPVTALENKLFIRMKFRFFQSQKKRRFLSILISYLVLLTIMLVLLGIIIPQLIRNVLAFIDEFQNHLGRLNAYLKNFNVPFNNQVYVLDATYLLNLFKNYLPNAINEMTTIVSNLIPNIIIITKTVALFILNFLLSIILSIYLLANKEASVENSKKAIIALFSKTLTVAILAIATYSHRIFSKFFIGKILDSLIVGALCFVILLIVGIPFPLLLSVMIGVANIIPYFGPFIGGGIGLFFLLLVNPMKALWFLVIVIALQQFDGNYLEPKIIGDSIGLSPFWVIFSIIVFGKLFGFIGLLIGAPLFSVIKTLIEHYIEYKYLEHVDVAPK